VAGESAEGPHADTSDSERPQAGVSVTGPERRDPGSVPPHRDLGEPAIPFDPTSTTQQFVTKTDPQFRSSPNPKQGEPIMKSTIDINAITTDAMNDARRVVVAKVATAYQEPLRKALEDTLLAAVATAATIEDATKQAAAAATATIERIGASRSSPVPRSVVLPPAPYVTVAPMPTAQMEPPKVPPPPPVAEPGVPLPFYPLAAKGGPSSDPPAIIPNWPPPPPAGAPKTPAGQQPAPAAEVASPTQPALAMATTIPPQPDLSALEAAAARKAEEKKWRKHLKRERVREDDLYFRAQYPFRFHLGFKQTPEVFTAIAVAIPESEAEALSIADIAHRANATSKDVLFVLTSMASTGVLCRKPATDTSPALVWLPPPAADDQFRDLKRAFIKGWRSP